jgi:PKD domain-containing protein
MDKRVFISMLIIILFAGIILGIRMCNKECVPPEITAMPEQPFRGNVITFKTNSDEDEKITWNFGDGESFTGNEAKHKYDSSATFIVIAKLEDNCEAQKVIFVKELPKMHAAIFALNIPSPIREKEPVTFNDATPDVTEWHWKVKETGETGEKSLFSPVFPRKGTYKITLSVNGAYVQGDTAFYVIVAGTTVKKDVPSFSKEKTYVPPPTDPKPKFPETPTPIKNQYLTDTELSEQFVQVANLLETNEDASDTWKDLVESEFCNGALTKVTVKDDNNEIQAISLDSFKTKAINGDYDVKGIRIFRSATKCALSVEIYVVRKK